MKTNAPTPFPVEPQDEELIQTVDYDFGVTRREPPVLSI